MAVATAADKITYTYDALGRLSEVTYPSALGVTYNYDAAGNRLQVQIVDTNPPSKPGVPTYTNVTQTSATANWTPASDNDSIASYEYQINSGSWVNVGNILSANLAGLTAATTYTVSVHAKDPGGYAGAASSSPLTTLPNPPGVPGAPTFSAITATTATMNWAAASGTVTAYSYSLNNGSTWTSVGTALTASLTGLTQATTYTALVHASNSGGTGPNSSGSFTTAKPPGAPGTPSVTSILAKTATVSWAAASGTVTGYSYSLNNGTTWTSVGTALSVSLNALTPATTYTVQVRGTNSGANGPSSSASFTTWHQITDSNGNVLSGNPYTTMLEPGTGPPYTDWVLKQNYGSFNFIWDVSGLCPAGGNSLTTTGYVRIAGGCEIDASPSVYGH